jgi:hypothetical protein
MTAKKRSSKKQLERADDKPVSPFPPQHQRAPGLDERMTPQPQFQGGAYRAAGKLEGKAALVTGGDSGIGRSVAFLFAREGADVAIVHLEEERSDATKIRDEILKLGRRALMLQGGVTDPAFCKYAVERTVDAFGRLNILVNNAAYQKRKKTIEEITDEEWVPPSIIPVTHRGRRGARLARHEARAHILRERVNTCTI